MTGTQRPVRITDTTLRDGSHAMSHQFTEEQVRATVHALDGAGVEVIECSHGDGIGGSSFNYGFSRTDEMTLIRAAYEEATQAKIAILLVPGIGTMDDLRNAREAGASVARIATHCTEADVSVQHFGLARSLGMETVGFLMMSHRTVAGGAGPAGAVHGRRRRRVRVRGRLGRRAACSTRPRSGSRRCTPRSAPRRRSASTATRTSRSASPTRSWPSRTAPGRSTVRCARSAPARATPPPRCWRRRSTTSASRPAWTCGGVLDAAEEVVRPYLPRWPKADRTAIVQGWAGVYSQLPAARRARGRALRRSRARDPAAGRREGLRRRPGGHAHRHRAAAGAGTRSGRHRRPLSRCGNRLPTWCG